MTQAALDLRVLASLARGLPRKGSHAARLEAFYRPQAAHYDSFRERLLAGRRTLIDLLGPLNGAHVVELGGGTGQNLEFFGDRLAGLARMEIVDLCPSLLAVARDRAAALPNVTVIEADATTYRPEGQADCVYFSYALTMIEDWRAAIENAIAMLRPGGILGVVDFHGGDAGIASGAVSHGAVSRIFWSRWFAHAGVHLNPEHLRHLRRSLPTNLAFDRHARVPYLMGLRAPYYLFIGRKGMPEDG
jgi:S-adenosylmethionine-diacylgycerolhomoserine-N-methlytransferase